MEYLSIIHLALGVAAVIPVLWPGGRENLKVLWIGALSLLVMVIVFQGVLEVKRRRQVKSTKREIVSILREKGSLTFEAICDCCFDWDPGITNRAIAELVGDGMIVQNKQQIRDRQGHRYLVRLFSLPGASPSEEISISGSIHPIHRGLGI